MKITKSKGIVKIELSCETSAILAPSLGDSPYAEGIITVLSPKGIAFAHKVATIISFGVFKSFSEITAIDGKTISLITVIT